MIAGEKGCMQTLGMIGGLGWQSTVGYYSRINRGVEQKMGQFHSAPLLLSSVEFAPILKMQGAGKWDEIASIMIDKAHKLEQAGSQGIMLCSNTMHTVADEVSSELSVPLLHVADAVGKAVSSSGGGTLGLVGTRFTMEGTFYAEKLSGTYGMDVLTPPKKERDRINSIIYNQLAKDIVTDAAKQAVLESVQSLVDRGAKGIVVGCTELPLLLKQKDVQVPLYDTLDLHIGAAVKFIIEAQ